MTERVARCGCGQLRMACVGEPERVSVCHCLDCQRRTGSAFAVQARFPRERVRAEGRSATWARRGEEGTLAVFHRCPTCGATVWWEPAAMPDLIYVAVGAFADPDFPPPQVSVYEDRRHAWALAPDAVPDDMRF